MPPAASVKLLYDDSANENTNNLASWSVVPSATPQKRCRYGICLAILFSLLIFLIGLFTGAFAHALLFPEGGSPLTLLSLSNETLNALPLINEINDVSEDSSEDDKPIRSKSNESNEENDNEQQEAPYLSTNSSTNSTASSECEGFPWSEERLPSLSHPEYYNVTIHPNITENTLHGSVTIHIKILNATRFLVINADRIELESFRLSVNHQLLEAEFFECDKLSQWAFLVKDAMKPDDFVHLVIEYKGEVRSDLEGLYISTHKDSRDRKSRSLITQFEPSFARRMFPCYDEPNYKAEFEVSVVREAHMVSRSNMNLKVTREHSEGLYVDVFEKSVKMSTYLLAVAVFDNYDYVKRTTKKTKEPIEVRLYAPRDSLAGQYEFSLSTAIKALEYFEDYFDIPYPLNKIDLVALDDFSEGAMENWGLVTFRDSALLHSDSNGSSITKEHIALIVCHEIAHQWFGNLVTMNWWNDLWLNEGFANYMEYKCVNHIYPKWNIMTRFYAENVALSQEPDGHKTSRAIDSQLSSHSNIINLFDAISYHKAAAIISMMESLSGEKNFRRALIEYLKEYTYENAEGSQLWDIVEKHVDLPDGVSIDDLAAAYTRQIGYPVIHVTLDNHNRVTVHNQTRFVFEHDDDDNESEDEQEEKADTKSNETAKWPIPMHYTTDRAEETKLQWMKAKDDNVSWSLSERANWVIVNTGGVGYFKVHYDKENYKQIRKQLMKEHKKISAVDRAMVVMDAFDFTKTETLPIAEYLNLIEYALDEDDRMAWSLLIKQLKTIDALVEESPSHHIFKDFQRSLILKAYEKFAWKDNVSKPLQVELINMSCRLRNKDCVKKAVAKFNQWIHNGEKPEPELFGVIVEEGVRNIGTAAWEKCLHSLQHTTVPSEKQHLITALTATHDDILLSRLLRMCLDNGPIRPNMIPRVFAGLANHHYTRTFAWRYLKANFEDFQKILGDDTPLMMTTLRALSDKLSTTRDLQDLKNFFEEHNVNTSQPKLEQLLEHITMNIRWREINQASIDKWLNDWDLRRRSIYRKKKHIKP